MHVPEIWQGVFPDAIDLEVGRAVKLAYAAVQRLVAGELSGLLLSGPSGAGKSMLAAAAANEIAVPLWESWVSAAEACQETAERMLDVSCPRWVSVPLLLGRVRREIRTDRRAGDDEIADVLDGRGLLILDDLGAERPTDWSLSVLFEMVASRYEDRGQLIATSNLTAPELCAMGYGRIVSRLADKGALLAMRGAHDYRLRLRRPVAVRVAEAAS